MAGQGYSISQAAKALGVSTRTVRRFIKAGKLQAELVNGPFGQEYHILELPTNLQKRKAVDNTPTQTPGQTSIQTHVQVMDIIRELQEKNLALAAQLGVATERIRNLENEVKLLTAARQRPWWKRLLPGKAR